MNVRELQKRVDSLGTARMNGVSPPCNCEPAGLPQLTYQASSDVGRRDLHRHRSRQSYQDRQV